MRVFAVIAWFSAVVNAGAAYASWQAGEYTLAIMLGLVGVGALWIAVATTGAIMRGEE